MNKRIIVTIILFVAVVACPYWVYIPLVVVASVFFSVYWEGIVFGFLIDVLYGVQAHAGISFLYPYALFTSILILIMLPVRERIRFDA